MEQGRYWVALFNRGGESAGVAREVAREPRLEVARSRYIESVVKYPSRLVMLCDRHGLGSERSDPGHASGWVSAKASRIMLLSQFIHIRMGKLPKFGMIEIDCRGYQLLQGIR